MCDDMANKEDYLTCYRKFFENFAQTVNPNDQLPVKLACYKLVNVEVVGGIIDWTTQYLTQKNCPPNLLAPLIKIVIEEIRKACKKQPVLCGFNVGDNAYEPLKLMQTVMAKTNEICLRYLDNSMLCSLPSPGTPYYPTSAFAMKNLRRRMEDRHVIIHDLNTMFNIQEASPSSYYAVFDGHAGHDAAAYSSAHLHQFLAENKNFISNPEQALLDAFCKTDALFLEKCKVESISSGTTAVVALLRPKEKTLYLAWVGDSQAVLVSQGRTIELVDPHKPDRQDERTRIEERGGYVMRLGIWRVNGQLAVSRAIGDPEYKPYVIAIPEVREVTLDGTEDFLIIACDGLWDYVSVNCASQFVYMMLLENSEDVSRIAQELAHYAKKQSSSDNISVIVVFLKEPSKIAAEARRASRNHNINNVTAVTMETGFDNANNPFAIPNGGAPPTDNLMASQKDNGLLLNLTDNFKQNGSDMSPMSTEFRDKPEKNCAKRLASSFYYDDEPDIEDGTDMLDEGPETDVDALSPIEKSPDKPFGDAFGNNNPITEHDEGVLNPFVEHQEKAAAAAALDMEHNLEKLQQQQHNNMELEHQQLETEEHHDMMMMERELHNRAPETLDDEEERRIAREETPTPPADTVHDVGVLVDNAAEESESEDEWNYIKGEEANKENIEPQSSEKEVAETTLEEESDNMSQLNPNAAEFVPISPTRSIPSPACRMLMNDEVISQSPKRPINVDINVPNITEFETEIQSRPSEIDTYSNGHNSDDDHNESASDKMENLLNGKNIDEILEFQPESTPQKSKPDEFHFGPNAAPFTPVKFLDQSEAALSTKALFGDESEAILDDGSMCESNVQDTTADLINKESDPMSMSFYADKGESNPFDLNQVQVLPKNIDEFLSEPDRNDTNSEEHSEVGVVDNDNAIQTTDLDKQHYDDEKELASPLEPEKEFSESAKSDDGKEECDDLEPNNETVLLEGFCQFSNKSSVIENIPTDIEMISSEARMDSPECVIPEQDRTEKLFEDNDMREMILDTEKVSDNIQHDVLKTDVVATENENQTNFAPEITSHILGDDDSKEETDEKNIEAFTLQVENTASEPELNISHISETLSEKIELAGRDEVKTPISDIYSDNKCDLFVSNSPVCDLPEAKSPVCDISEKSSVCDISESKSPIPEQEISVGNQETNLIIESCDYTKPELLQEANQHFEELCKPQDEALESPHADITSSVKDDVSSPAKTPEILGDNFVEEQFEKIESCPINQSTKVEEESNKTEDDNNLPVDITNQSIGLLSSQVEQIDVKTENITPEFPEAAVVTPCEESKHEDVPTAPPLEEPAQEPNTEILNEITAATLSTAAALTAVGGVTAALAATVPESAPETTGAVVEIIDASVQEKQEKSSVVEASAAESTPAKSVTPTNIKIDDKKKPTPAKKLPTTTKSATKTTTPKTGTTPAKSTRPIQSPKPAAAKTGSTTKSPVTNTSPKASATGRVGLTKTTKPTTTAASPKPAGEKKPLTNGDVKAPIKSSVTAKKAASETVATKTLSKPSSAASKPSTTRVTSQRPSTAPRTTAPRTAPAPTAAAKPRPTTLSSRPAPAKPLTSTATKSTLNKTSPKTATAPAAKPRATTLSATNSKPRVPLSARPLSKPAADTEKQNKESANKITASKTTSSTVTKTTGPASTRTSTSVRKVESKTMGARTTVSKTTTTTMKSTTAKKPAEIIKHPTSKPKTTKIEKPKENGVSTIVTEEITMVNTTNSVINDEPGLLKDNSPVDNKLLIDENKLVEVNAAD